MGERNIRVYGLCFLFLAIGLIVSGIFVSHTFLEKEEKTFEMRTISSKIPNNGPECIFFVVKKELVGVSCNWNK